ncbi:membrane protein [Flammeovirgaceae bacterium 311]|nr:membrane protein [Flammeovirgaceae bacterium 311]
MQEEQIERLIKISKNKPLLPEVFVPWKEDPADHEIFLTEKLTSLYGDPLYHTLNKQQQLELGRHEVVQVMYSYAWSEGLFCLFMNRYILTLMPDSIEYRFLLRELIEEFRHQDMFTDAILRINGKPVKPTFMHKFVGVFTARFMPSDAVFLSDLSVEVMADTYGTYLRKDPSVYKVLRKVSELHNIEEARHIIFAKDYLSRFVARAGFLRRSWYSYLVLLNIYFMRTLYVKKEIFERIGAADPERMYRAALKYYEIIFAQECLGDITAVVEEWKGFNWATRWAWRWLLKAKV